MSLADLIRRSHPDQIRWLKSDDEDIEFRDKLIAELREALKREIEANFGLRARLRDGD